MWWKTEVGCYKRGNTIVDVLWCHNIMDNRHSQGVWDSGGEEEPLGA